MRKLSNIVAAAVLAVGLTSGLGASAAYAASDDTSQENQIVMASQVENGASGVLSGSMVNDDTLLSSYQDNSVQNGALENQFTNVYDDTITATTGSDNQGLEPVNPDSQDVSGPAVAQPGGLQVADVTPADDDLQPAVNRPTIAISGDVTAGAGSVTVAVTDVTQNNWSVQLRVFDASTSQYSTSTGSPAGSQDFTASAGEGTYHYTINCTWSQNIVEGSKIVAFLIIGSATQSFDVALVKSRNDVPASVSWASSYSQIDVLTSEINLVFNVGTTVSPRTYDVLVSSNPTIFTSSSTEPVGTMIAQGQIIEDGTVSVPVSLSALLNYYIDVIMMVPNFESQGMTVYSHAGVRRIVGDSAQIAVSYDTSSNSYTLTGSVISASRPNDQYQYAWYSPSDETLGTGTVLSGVAESRLNGLYLLVSVPSESVSLPERRVSVRPPVWAALSAVVAEATSKTVSASWPAVERVISQANVNVAAMSYLVSLMRGSEVVASKTVTSTSATFEDVPSGTYCVVVTPKSESTNDGEDLWSSAVDVIETQDDPVIVDPDPIIYTVTSEDEWVKNSEEDKVFHGEGLLDKFTGATLDGAELSESLYVISNGSTVLTLAASYLETLATGVHTLAMQWTDGSGSKTFTIKEAGVTPDPIDDPDPDPIDDPDPDPIVDPDPDPDPVIDPENQDSKKDEPTKEEAVDIKPAPATPAKAVEATTTTAVATGNDTMPQTADPLGVLVWMHLVAAIGSWYVLRRCYEVGRAAAEISSNYRKK